MSDWVKDNKIRCRECNGPLHDEKEAVFGGVPLRAIHKNGDICTKNKIAKLQHEVYRLRCIVESSSELKTEREMFDALLRWRSLGEPDPSVEPPEFPERERGV